LRAEVQSKIMSDPSLRGNQESEVLGKRVKQHAKANMRGLVRKVENSQYRILNASNHHSEQRQEMP